MHALVDGFIGHIQKEKRFSAHTVLAYSKDLEQFLYHMMEGLGIGKIADVDHHDVRSWIVSIMEGRKLEAATVNRKISCLRSFFKYLMRKKAVGKDPMARIASLKTKKKLPLFLEQKQMDTLLDGLDFGEGFEGLRDKVIIELLYNTGMRRAELCGVKETDLDTGRQEIKVLGKRNKERLIPLSQPMLRMLDRYNELRSQTFKGENSSGHLLVNDRGEKMSGSFVYRKVNKYLRLVTTLEKKSPHILRHTFATQMLNNGADINAIKELLGHADLSATQVYTHNSIEKLTRVYKQAHPRA